MKVKVSIQIGNQATDADGPFANASTEITLEVGSTNPTQAVADLIVAAEQAVRQMK